MDLVTVFGGTGFLGRHVVDRLVQAGFAVRIAARHPTQATAAHGQEHVTTTEADVRDEAAVARAVAGAHSVVNAVSAYVERGDITYKAIHEIAAANVATACARQGASRLVHISGVGADATSSSRYISSRGRGELAVRHAFPRVTILRPSVMFGPDDAFLNTLARIVRSTPLVPLLGGGLTRLQPVHVDDVAEAALRILQNPEPDAKIYELGGPDVLTLRQIIQMVAARLGRRPVFVPIPLGLAHSLAQVLEHLPMAPLTVAQVDLLKYDNVLAQGEPNLNDLGIAPRRLDDAIGELASCP